MKLFSLSSSLTCQTVHQEKFTPVKYFSIDRVFRNETLDATHLAEFHQIEGVVADYGLTLGDLMGILHQFFTKLGQEGCMTLNDTELLRTAVSVQPDNTSHTCFWNHTNPAFLVSFLGITKLRFKPAYNPYTEPSMEVFSYHEGIVKLLQIIYNHSHTLKGSLPWLITDWFSPSCTPQVTNIHLDELASW